MLMLCHEFQPFTTADSCNKEYRLDDFTNVCKDIKNIDVLDVMHLKMNIWNRTLGSSPNATSTHSKTVLPSILFSPILVNGFTILPVSYAQNHGEILESVFVIPSTALTNLLILFSNYIQKLFFSTSFAINIISYPWYYLLKDSLLSVYNVRLLP